ncbi:hypothetical protein FRC07_002271 [Ceratobasidium sp. 392]|nr:hypothetical protein FRC07_002271 [Ceratobasidium sp. 392]
MTAPAEHLYSFKNASPPGTKVFNSFDSTIGLVSASRVVEGLLAKGKIMVICGAGVSVAAGIPAFRSENGLYHQYFSTTSGRVKGSTLFKDFDNAAPSHLKVINQNMTKFRRTARNADETKFLRWLRAELTSTHILRVLTRNFDGLETRDRPDLEDSVTMLHGDNRTLKCSNSGCPDVCGASTIQFDDAFLSENGVAECPTCSAARDSKKGGRHRAQKVPELRPAVRLDGRIDSRLESSYFNQQFSSELESCATLLIVGTSLKKEIHQIVRIGSYKINGGEGAVIYVDEAPVASTHAQPYRQYVHYHFQMNSEDFFEHLLRQTPGTELAADIWIELGERFLQAAASSALPSLSIPMCCQCDNAEPDLLVQCIKCQRRYCYEIPDNINSSMCVKVNYFSDDPAPSAKELESTFVCDSCHDHSASPYPHHTLPVREFYRGPEQSPRLICIMFYLGQFWPTGEAILHNLVSTWRRKAWDLICLPVRLQTVAHLMFFVLIYDPSVNAHAMCTVKPHLSDWAQDSFRTLVIYVTHGTSGERHFQIKDKQALAPVPFLKITLKAARPVLDRSKESYGVMLACGHVYDSAREVDNIQAWLDRTHALNGLLGTLNKTLIPCYFINMLSQLSIVSLGYKQWSDKLLMDTWMRDPLASTHSDLLRFAPLIEPAMFLFSPFQTRPLGIELPNILEHCQCVGPRANKPKPTTRKFWKVSHDGRGKETVSEITVTYKCSLCGDWWKSKQENLPGTLHQFGGLYCAAIPFFEPETPSSL